jgi:hypothetical protein
LPSGKSVNPVCESLRIPQQPAMWSFSAVAEHPQETSWTHRLKSSSSSKSCSVCQHGQEILTFQVFVIGQNLIDSHARTEQFQERFHGITESTDTRFAVTHHWINRNSRE